ncbi:hypothetical protein HYU09_02905 [Candidatus Woesearchaeota archaeon]|nr:hypothetical protein [Candidatus Woesearchaeota archaeon]
MEAKHNEYFEGILQVRNPNDEVLDFIEKEVSQKGNVFIAKAKKTNNGIDFYISSQRFLRTLGNRLQERFSGHLEVSRRLHTRNRMTSRDVYRVNLLFKMPGFKKGDIIKYRGDDVKIIGMAKKVLAKDIRTGKKLNLSYKVLIK